jgi:adenine-specific DNA methylase
MTNRHKSNHPTQVPPKSTTLGWRPTCGCKPDALAIASHRMTERMTDRKPCTILDPFGGSGTTGLVANQLGRDAILIELNPEYAKMAEARIGKGLRPATYRDETKEGDAPLFTSQ